MDLSGAAAYVDGGELPDSNAQLAGAAGKNVVYRNGTLTATRFYTLAAGTNDGDQLTIVMRNLTQVVTFAVPGSGGVLFPVSAGMQSLVLEWSAGAWHIIDGSTDTIVAVTPGPYFSNFGLNDIPGGAGDHLIGVTQVLVENNYRWCVDVCLQVLPTVDTVIDFDLRLDDGGGENVIAQWSEYFSPETAAYCRTMQVISASSGGTPDGNADLLLYSTNNAGGVAVPLTFPSNMMAHRWDQIPG